MKATKLQQSANGSANLELSQVMARLASGEYKNVVFMVGAGISTAAGIPDFRSPGTGLYSNLAKLDLPFAEAVFDIDFLREKPEPFYVLAKELFPGQFDPTEFHYFMKWVADQGYLKRIYTQNIDTLERLAGIKAHHILEAHGSFASSHCIECGHEVPIDEVRKVVFESPSGPPNIPKCPKCNGIVKPDIVFFGEAMPDRFFELWDADFEDAGPDEQIDLAIIAGTSLQVEPFASLPELLNKSCHRVLFNTERVGSIGSRPNDIVVLGQLETIRHVLPAAAAASIAAAVSKHGGTKSKDKVENPGLAADASSDGDAAYGEAVSREGDIINVIRKDMEALGLDESGKSRIKDEAKCGNRDKNESEIQPERAVDTIQGTTKTDVPSS